MRFNVEFIFVIWFWVYREGWGLRHHRFHHLFWTPFGEQ